MSHQDITIANMYRNKFQSAKDMKHEFSISFNTFKRCRMRKRCALSGLPMTTKNSTVDRLDNTKGYVEGNVAGVREDINSIKGTMESWVHKNPEVTWKVLQKLINNTIKELEKNE